MGFNYEKEFLTAMTNLDAENAKGYALAGGFGAFDYPEGGNMTFLENTIAFWTDQLKTKTGELVTALELESASSEAEIKQKVQDAYGRVDAGLIAFLDEVFTDSKTVAESDCTTVPYQMAQSPFSCEALEAVGRLLPDAWTASTGFGSPIAYTGFTPLELSDLPLPDDWRKTAAVEGILEFFLAGQKRKFAWFLERGLSPESSDEDGLTAAMYAVVMANFDWILEVAEENSVDMSSAGLFDGEVVTGYTPLMLACQVDYNYKLQFIQSILELGANPNAQAIDGTSAMLIAQSKGDKLLINLLKNKGAKPPSLFGRLPDSFAQFCKERSIG